MSLSFTRNCLLRTHSRIHSSHSAVSTTLRVQRQLATDNRQSDRSDGWMDRQNDRHQMTKGYENCIAVYPDWCDVCPATAHHEKQMKNTKNGANIKPECGMKLNGEWNNRCRLCSWKHIKIDANRDIRWSCKEKIGISIGHARDRLLSTLARCAVHKQLYYIWCDSWMGRRENKENTKQNLQLFMPARRMEIKCALNVDVWTQRKIHEEEIAYEITDSCIK